MHYRRVILALACAAIALLPGTFAPTVADAQDVGRQLNNRTYVGEELELNNMLMSARDFEGQGEIDAALDTYVRAMAEADRWQTDPPRGQSPRTVMTRLTNYELTLSTQAGRGVEYSAQTFIPVTDYCRMRIMELPARTRDLYRQSVEPKAKVLLDDAIRRRDRAAVQDVADRYWMSASGIDALDMAATLAFEAGDFQVAIHYWDRMRQTADVAFGRDPQRIVRLAAAAWQVGDTYTWRSAVAEAKRRFDGFPAVVGDTRVANLVELLQPERLESLFFGRAPWIEPAGMQRPLGNDRHARPAPAFSSTLVAFPPIDLSMWFRDTGNERFNRFQQPGMPGGSDRNQVMVSVAESQGKLVVQGPRAGSLIELSLPDAAPIEANPLGRRFAFEVDRFMRAPSNPMRVFGPTPERAYMPAIHNDHIFCVFRPGDMSDRGRFSQGGDVLACFSLRAGGAVKWVTPSSESDDPNAGTLDDLQKMGFCSSPAFGNGMVYLGAYWAHGRDTVYELLAFDEETGKLRWRRQNLASQLNDNNFGRNQMVVPEPAVVSVDHGLVLFQTNAGAIISADGLTGAVRWTMRYRRPDNAGSADPFRQNVPMTTTQWFNNAPAIHRGVGYFTPTDCERLLCVETRTGEYLRAWPEDGETAADLEYLLGVSHNVLHIQGRTRVHGLDLSWDHPEGPERGGSDVAYETVEYTANSNELAEPGFVKGRGVLTSDAIFVPTQRGLVRYNARNGKREGDLFMPMLTDLPAEHMGHLSVITLPDTVSAPGSPNSFSNHALIPGEPVRLPADKLGPDGKPVATETVPTQRTYLVVTTRQRITLVAVK
ncbi:MAG: PQQ-binding-like beta-propeller repeat protein [Planctomycetota bacterium]